MKLSPLDIEHQEFDTALSGFNKRQVREFLAHVAEAYEELLREIQSLRDELKQRDKTIEELQVAEVELKRAVIAAERIGNELKANARREAELIIEEARAKHEKILRDAEARLKEINAEVSRLQKESQLFREQFRGLLKAYERSLENLPKVKGGEPVAEAQASASVLLDE